MLAIRSHEYIDWMNAEEDTGICESMVWQLQTSQILKFSKASITLYNNTVWSFNNTVWSERIKLTVQDDGTQGMWVCQIPRWSLSNVAERTNRTASQCHFLGRPKLCCPCVCLFRVAWWNQHCKCWPRAAVVFAGTLRPARALTQIEACGLNCSVNF